MHHITSYEAGLGVDGPDGARHSRVRHDENECHLPPVPTLNLDRIMERPFFGLAENDARVNIFSLKKVFFTRIRNLRFTLRVERAADQGRAGRQGKRSVVTLLDSSACRSPSRLCSVPSLCQDKKCRGLLSEVLLQRNREHPCSVEDMPRPYRPIKSDSPCLFLTLPSLQTRTCQ